MEIKIIKNWFSKKPKQIDLTTALPVISDLYGNSETREFPTPVVISVTTGRLACTMDDIYDILSYLADENLYTHDLALIASELTPAIEELYPWLTDLELPEGGGTKFTNAIADLVKKHGETLALPVMVNRVTTRNPMDRLSQALNGATATKESK